MTTTYKLATTIRRDSRELGGVVIGRGVDCYAVPHPASKGKQAFMLLADRDRRYTVSEVAAEVIGSETLDNLDYSVEVRCSEGAMLDLLPHLLYTHRGRVPQWLPTATGFASPTYRNAEFHDRLTTLAERLDAAVVIVTISRNGHVLETVRVKWASRDERGRYVSKSRRDDDLFNQIDAAAEPHRIRKRNLHRA